MNHADRAYRKAEKAMTDFRRSWFDEKGGSRANGVQLAHAAAAAVEEVWPYEERLSDADVEQLEKWLSDLLHVPEIEKEWFGLAEYRETHRVKGRGV